MRYGEGSGNAYIMPKTDSHCPLIMLISDNAMIFRLYIHGWLIIRQYRELEAGENQSLKSERRDQESNSGPIAPQAKSLTTTSTLLLHSM